MGSRYGHRRIFYNSQDIYDNILEDRGLKFMTQYNTPSYHALNMDQIGSLKTIERVWTIGDRLYKLAAEYYGSPVYWWVIARFNQKPTEAHFQPGDRVYIPLPKDLIFEYYGI